MAVPGDTLQGLRQIFLYPPVAFLPVLPIRPHHGFLAGGNLGENHAAAVEAPGDPVGEDEAVLGKIDGGLDDLRHAHGTVFLQGQGESGRGARDADGQVMNTVGVGMKGRTVRPGEGNGRIHGTVPVFVQVHPGMSLARRFLAVIDRYGRSVGQTYDHEPATADVAGRWMGHRQGQSEPHGGVDGVTALLQDICGDLRGQGFHGNRHAFLADYRLAGRCASIVYRHGRDEQAAYRNQGCQAMLHLPYPRYGA